METETPETNACYARAGMMLAAQVDELDATCRKLELQRNQLVAALEEMRYGHTEKAENMAIAALAYLENVKSAATSSERKDHE